MSKAHEKILILTGAGISAASGISTFRDKGGIWSKYKVEDVATPEGFARDPGKVLEFYNKRRRVHWEVKPNAAHLALAELEAKHPGEVLIVTQNVDELHERAGSKNVIHMHGEVFKAWCRACEAKPDWREELLLGSTCPACGVIGKLRPDVVWFGEMPYHMDMISDALLEATLFVSIGTSGNVAPASHFVARARACGAQTLELNLEPSLGAFDEARHGEAVEVVPKWVAEVLASMESDPQ